MCKNESDGRLKYFRSKYIFNTFSNAYESFKCGEELSGAPLGGD